ncbi:site-specific integrase [Rhodohalobacter sp. SW132]|uniref:tyrosine-type recombinase/integrase n=1 Tax=Rhodohalobacter sp. SW132 TaxID=2293433 RepID=UPI000E284B36|nr:site-specific integrase [Rhodohalobacter sp. SW132]REL39127.1 site-specific integrase [Rhodohalobacter sp. SW132]
MPIKKLSHTFIKKLKNPRTRIEYSDTVVDGLVLRVTKTGHKSFCFRYGASGKRYTIGKFPTLGLADARKVSKKLAIDVAMGIDPMKKRKQKERDDKNTFNNLTANFIKYYTPSLRPKTKYEYERIINKELIPEFGSSKLKDITRAEIQKFLDRVADKRDKATMSNRIRSVLSRLFSYAIDRGMTENNPVISIPPRKKGENKRERYYSEKEIKKLWSAFEQESEPIQSLFKILLLCGQRKGETSRMRWSDIESGVWTIPSKDSKSNREHRVPLSSTSKNIIGSLKSHNGHSDYVFKSPVMENDPIQWFKRAVDRIQEESKVSDFRIHDLRRTAATYMAQLKIDRTVLGKILNHKGLSGDSQITAIYDRYSYMEEKREAIELWNNYLLTKILTKN